jgi:superfamily I DNA and/or RNA helicase
MGTFDINVSYDQGNKYERGETLKLNLEMLVRKRGDLSFNVTNIVNKMELLKKETKEKIEELVNVLTSRHTDWGFKDPRTCLTYSIWQHHIPNHKLIVVVRNPAEVWFRYKRIHAKKTLNSVLIAFRSLRAWYIYNNEIIKHLKKVAVNYIVLDYGRFMGDNSELNKLRRFTERNLVDCRENILYRSGKKNDPLYNLACFIHKYFFLRDIKLSYSILLKYSQDDIG